MAKVNHSSDSRPARLPSPGVLLIATVLLVLLSAGGWFGWRVHRQQALLDHFTAVGAQVESVPADPVWLHDALARMLSSESARGLTDITSIDLQGTDVTDADLRYLSR